jgi:hypothetical protein
MAQAYTDGTEQVRWSWLGSTQAANDDYTINHWGYRKAVC